MLPKLMRRRGLVAVVLAFDDSEGDRCPAPFILLLTPLFRGPAALRPADMAAQASLAAAAYQWRVRRRRRRIGGERGNRRQWGDQSDRDEGPAGHALLRSSGLRR